MRTLYLAGALLVCAFSARAQMQSLDVSVGFTGGQYGNVHFDDPSAISANNKPVLHYSDIEGTPFWNEHGNPALLFLRNGKAVKFKVVKMNLYTSDVHYVDDKGVELVAAAGLVQKVVFLNDKDTTKVASVFEAYPDPSATTGYTYYKVLNDGKWKLLELQKSFIRTVPLDAMSGKTSESSFFVKTSYAIAQDENISPVKSLNRSNITSVIHPDDAAEQWLKTNKNNLKNESDIVAFLTYYNAQKK